MSSSPQLETHTHVRIAYLLDVVAEMPSFVLVGDQALIGNAQLGVVSRHDARSTHFFRQPS